MKNLVSILILTIALTSCKRDKGAEEQPLPAQTMNNVSYGNDPAQKMDIYLPEGRTDTTKVLVLVHGGAWSAGDKADMNPHIPVLKQKLPGYAIVNINYRLATPFANYFPSQEMDMKAALDYLVNKADELVISDKFVLLGASAGGHMVMLQAYKYQQPQIKAVVNFFGPSDMAALYSETTNPAIALIVQILMQGAPADNPAMYQQSGPIHFVNSQSPPTIIIHGDNDVVVPISQSIALKNKLQAEGVPHQLEVYPGIGHDVWPPATMDDAINKVVSFIKQYD